MKKNCVVLAVAAFAAIGAFADVVIENPRFRFVLGDDAKAKSLVLKATGEELLDLNEDLRAFAVIQNRPFNNEVKLTFPNKRTEYRADRVRRAGDFLYIGFELISYEAQLKVTEAADYVTFELVDFPLGPRGSNHLKMTYPPVDVMKILDLPVKNRKYFGGWLNVSWDDAAAVAVVAAEPYTWIDSSRRHGFRLMTAEAHRNLKLRGAKTALVVAATGNFMDAMDAFERDLGLPRGVQSRRSQEIKSSIYWSSGVRPSTVDRHLAYAKQGGFRNMLIYYPAICKGAKGDGGYGGIADYELLDEYVNGYDSLKEMLAKIKAAGITPGLHVLQTFIGFKTRYVTPVADPRLNLTTHFTLAKPLGKEDGDVWVHEDPSNCPTNEASRILAFGGELISYEGFTTERPYKFTGVKRGAKETTIVEHPNGQIGGILDVCEFGGVSCYIDQNTDLQDEVAEKIAKIYNCGFEFMYCDGSEGVNVPQGIHVPNAQYRVWKKFDKKPLFMEGAAKAHFGWHHLSGANAFDVFPPEIFKDMIVRWPLYAAPIMRQDFSRLNFGWWGIYQPSDKSVGTQPDMWEFGTSKGAAWDCPATIQFNLPALEKHPRMADLLEVMRRWEDVRAKKWLTDAQREALKDPKREFHLYLDDKGAYTLYEIEMLPASAEAKLLRGFVFERDGKRVVAYWHTRGEGEFTLDWAGPKTLKADKMRYLETPMTKAEIAKAFSTAKEGGTK